MMTATLLPIEKAPVQVIQLTPQFSFDHWETEIRYWTQEVNFYYHLLRMGLDNGAHRTRPLFMKLRQEFAKYKSDILPSLEALLNEPKMPQAALQKELSKHQQELKRLKTAVFPHLSEMQSITIQ